MKAIGLVLVVAAAAACQTNNPNYCKGDKDNNCALGGGGGGGGDGGMMACTASTQCTATTTPVCDTSSGSGVCVPCTTTDIGACAATTPICSNEACVGCTMHSQCTASDACLPDGSCGDDSTVAYVSSSGTNEGTCTFAAPCATISYALSTTAKPYIKVTGAIMDQIAITRGVTILADVGATVTDTNIGAVVTVTTSSAVVIDYLGIQGGAGLTGYGLSLPSGSPDVSLDHVTLINNEGGGVNALSGSITIAQSTISANHGGGIALDGAGFDIENCFITGNGVAGPTGSATGGVNIKSLGAGSHVLAFDTIADNSAANGLVVGVACGSVAPAITITDDIVYDNGTMETGGANCSYTYSLLGPDGNIAGTGNMNLPPQFKGSGNYHILDGSPAKDHADPNATLLVDVDGDMRPIDSVRDIGADETQ